MADPKGWTSHIPALDNVTRVLAATIDVPPSSIKHVLEEEDRDHRIFSCDDGSESQPDSEVFYLFSGGSGDTFRVENPRTREEVWDALSCDDWYARLTLTALDGD